MYLHSSKQNAARLLKEGNLKQRFLFTSGIQCSLHRVAHDHFGLSNAKIVQGTIIMQISLKEEFISNEGRAARNGFVGSVSVDALPIREAGLRVTGVISLA
eukprot:5610718-Amphidinium_carterae.1